MKQKRARFNFNLREADKQLINDLAEQKGVNATSIVIIAVREYAERQRRPIYAVEGQVVNLLTDRDGGDGA